MKPCLVHKTSTSDEELQSNETNQIISSLTNIGRSNEQPTHGILKVPSGKIFFFSIKISLIFFRFNKSRIICSTSFYKTFKNKK
jgi:hypothetical protein